MESGADLAIGSVHKTLTGLAQTSVLSVKGDRIDVDRLQQLAATGVMVEGAADESLAQFRVVA